MRQIHGVGVSYRQGGERANTMRRAKGGLDMKQKKNSTEGHARMLRRNGNGNCSPGSQTLGAIGIAC